MIPDLSGLAVDRDLREEAAEIATRLRRSDGERTDITTRRKACQEAFSFAEGNPDAAYLLYPSLTTVIRDELEREYADAASEMIEARVSHGIQARAAETLAETVEPKIGDIYDQQKHLESCSRALADLLAAGETNRGRLASLEALASLTWPAPELVCDTIDVTRVVRALPSLFTSDDALRQSSRSRFSLERDALRLLAVFSVYSPSTVPIAEALTTFEEISLIRDSDRLTSPNNFVAQAYAAVVVDMLDPIDDSHQPKWVERGGPLLTGLENVVRDPPGSRASSRLNRKSPDDNRRQAARAVGHVFTFHSTRSADLPEELVEAATTGENFETAAERIGLLLTFSPTDNPEAWHDLIEDVADKTGDSRRELARVLGEVVVFSPGYNFEGSERLVTEVATSTGRDSRKAAEALGLYVAFSSESEIDALQAYIDVATSETDRKQAFELLGLMMALSFELETNARQLRVSDVHDSQDVSELASWMEACGAGRCSAGHDTPVPAELVERVVTESGHDRRMAAELLGKVVLQNPAEHFDFVRNVVTAEVFEAKTRIQAAQALGITVAFDSERSFAGPEVVVEDVIGRPSRDSVEAATLLGEAVAFEVTSTTQQQLIDRVTTGSTHDRQVAAKLLGHSVAFETKSNRAVSDALIEDVTTLKGRDRVEAAKTLGYVVAYNPGENPDAFRSLVDEIHSDAEADREKLHETLGRVAAFSSRHGVKLQEDLVNEVTTQGRRKACTAAKEIGAAVAYSHKYGSEARESLIDHIQDLYGRDVNLTELLDDLVAFSPDLCANALRAIHEFDFYLDDDHSLSDQIPGSLAVSHQECDGASDILYEYINERDIDEDVGRLSNHVRRLMWVRHGNGLQRRAFGWFVGTRMYVEAVTQPDYEPEDDPLLRLFDRIPELSDRYSDFEPPEPIAAIPRELLLYLGISLAFSPEDDVELIEEIHEDLTTSRSRQGAAKLLGKVIIASSETQLNVSQEFVDNVRSLTGSKRDWGAQALGTTAAFGPVQDTDAVEVLLERVHRFSGTDQLIAATLLGKLAAFNPAYEPGVPQRLVQRVYRQRGTGLSAARTLGLVVAQNPADVLDRLLGASSRMGSEVMPELISIVESGLVDAHTFFDAIDLLSMSEYDPRYQMLLDHPTRETLDLINTVVTQHSGPNRFPKLRSQIQYLLTENGPDPASRVKLVDILAMIHEDGGREDP